MSVFWASRTRCRVSGRDETWRRRWRRRAVTLTHGEVGTGKSFFPWEELERSACVLMAQMAVRRKLRCMTGWYVDGEECSMYRFSCTCVECVGLWAIEARRGGETL